MSKLNSSPSSLHGETMPEEEYFEEMRQIPREQSPSPSNATNVYTPSNSTNPNVYTSANSSVHSLVLTEFENSDISLPDLDKGQQKNLPKSLKVKHMRLLTKKRQEIIEVQKLVTHQQSLYMNLYAQIKDLEARSGVDSGDKLGKMRFLTMKGWPPHDLLMLLKDDSKDKDFEGELGPAVLKQLRADLSSIPQEVSALAKELLLRRFTVLDCLRKRLVESKTKTTTNFDLETKEIQRQVSDTCKNLEAKVTRIRKLAETSWRDREDLIAKINHLNQELSTIDNKVLQDVKKETSPGEQLPNTKSSELNITDLKEKLHKERAARESLKHMVETAESLLRKARMRITVLERELKTTQKQMQASARKHHEYELLHRCRETSYGVRSKKLLEDSKSGEETIEMLTLQRDALELRVKELQDQIKVTVADYETRESKQQAALNRVQDKVEEQVKHRVAAEARVAELEKRIKEVHEEYKRLFEKSDKLVKLNSDKCLEFLPQKEVEPSLNETALWMDLQATRKKLEEITQDLRQSRDDKDSLLNSLARIAQEGSETNMGNELLLREQKIFQLQQDIEELKEDIKTKSAIIAQKDNVIITLRMEASRADYECSSQDTTKQNLSIEIMELTERVATLTREREMLMKTAVSRTLMLERHERCAELFAKITRARVDMVALLEGREHPHSVPAVLEANLKNSLPPLAIKAAETFSELRADRERIQQLQDVVASQNQQLQRERRVRNQLEQRRAILERLFLNRATSTPYIPAENVAAYLGTSSYMANDVFDGPS